MSVRRVIRALALHRWPAGTVEASNDYYRVADPAGTVTCLDCGLSGHDVIDASAGYEIVLRCEPGSSPTRWRT